MNLKLGRGKGGEGRWVSDEDMFVCRSTRYLIRMRLVCSRIGFSDLDLGFESGFVLEEGLQVYKVFD